MRIRIWGILSGALGAMALMGWLEQHSLYERQVTEIREVFKTSTRELRTRGDAFWLALERRFPGGKLHLGSSRKLELVPVRDPSGAPGKLLELSAQLQWRNGQSAAEPVSIAPMELYREAVRSGLPDATSYLLDVRGVILSHPSLDWLGQKVENSPAYRDGVRRAVTENRTLLQTRARGADGRSVALSVLGLTPEVFLVLERPFPAVASEELTRLGKEWATLGLMSALCFGLGMLSVLWGRMSALRHAAAQENVTQAALDPMAMAEQTLTPPPSPYDRPVEVIKLSADLRLANALEGLASARSSRVALRTTMDDARAVLESEAEGFERWGLSIVGQAARVDPRDVSERVVQTIQRILKVPVIYLHALPRHGRAIYQASAGFLDPREIPLSMSFTLTPDIDRAVLDAHARKAVARLETTDSIAQAVLARTGVAHFEAWAVTRPGGDLGRATGRPQLVGVLIALRPTSQSVEGYASLARVLKATGQLYEQGVPLPS